jgi:tRNA threonylcarbamoyladenosine modification (KEOPS) complex  Pcc1 subunit
VKSATRAEQRPAVASRVTLSLSKGRVTLSLSKGRVTLSLSKGRVTLSLSKGCVTLSLSKGDLAIRSEIVIDRALRRPEDPYIRFLESSPATSALAA